jgi:hypothetical protein
MAFALVQNWTAGGSTADPEALCNPVSGDWLFAIVTWRVLDGSTPLMSVTDTPRNIWTLLYSGTTTAYAAHTGAAMWIQIWACPAVNYAGWDLNAVHAAAMQITTFDSGHIILHVAEFSGFVNGHLTVDSVTLNTANASTSFSVTSPAPSGGANCLHLAAVVVDDTAPTITPTGAGFTANSSFSYSTPPAFRESSQFKAATTGQTASWTASSATNWAGVIVAVRETGTGPSASTNWPAVRFGVGLGFDMNTPLTAVRYTDQTTRLVDTLGQTVFTAMRGIPQELGTALSQPTDLMIRNDDGAYTPRTANPAASANASGTTTTIKIADANATNINKADFFQLKTSGLVLKEFTVFQVVSTSSAAGTTTVTFARADGVAGGAAVSTASGDVYAGIAVDLNIPWAYDMYWAGKWWPLGRGWFGDLSQTFDNAWWGRVPATSYDALSTMTAADRSRLSGEILRRRPLYYWPCSDEQGATGAVDVSGNGGPPLVQTASKWGTGSGQAEFGAATSAIEVAPGQVPPGSIVYMHGDQGTCWQQHDLVAADLIAEKGFALVGQGLDVDITNGCTIIGVSEVLTPDIDVIANSEDVTIMIVKNSDPGQGLSSGAMLRLQADHGVANFLKPQLTVWDKDTHASTTTLAGSGQVLGTAWRMWAVTFDRTAWTVYDSAGTFTSGTCDLPARFGVLDIGGEADQFFSGNCYPGRHAHIAVYNRRLTSDEISGLDTAMRDIGGVQNSTKITTKLNVTRWNGARDISASDVLHCTEGPPSGTVKDTGDDIADQDDGLAFLDACGAYQWRGHVPGYYQTSKATFGEDTTGGEIPFTFGNKPFAYDGTYLYTDVQATNSRSTSVFKAISATVTSAGDTTAQGKRGVRTLPLATKLQQPEDVYGLAWTRLNRYKNPQLRAGEITVDCAKQPYAWTTCLSLEVGDLVTVKRRPLNAPAISTLCRVLQVKPATGPNKGEFTLTLGAADTPVLVLGSGVTLGTGTIGW